MARKKQKPKRMAHPDGVVGYLCGGVTFICKDCVVSEGMFYAIEGVRAYRVPDGMRCTQKNHDKMVVEVAAEEAAEAAAAEAARAAGA